MKELLSKNAKKVLQFVDKFATIIKKVKGDLRYDVRTGEKAFGRKRSTAPS